MKTKILPKCLRFYNFRHFCSEMKRRVLEWEFVEVGKNNKLRLNLFGFLAIL